MTRHSSLGVATLAALAAASYASSALAGDFDASGAFTFASTAVVKLDFETFSASADAGASNASVQSDATALAGTNVLSVSLADEGYPIPLALPKQPGSYRLTYFMKGDCTGGAAVDYGDGRPGTVSQAFPTGRVTSDGWLEMRTQPFLVAGDADGVDARMYLSAYDATQPTKVLIDAVEVAPDGTYAAPASCLGLDTAGACDAGQMCLDGTCRDVRGWFPPLPSDAERTKIVAYWKKKLGDTFGPYELRKTTLPVALSTLDAMAQATDNVEFWGRFMEAIRQLKDAHTYARVTSSSGLPLAHPLDACFLEGDADASQTAAASQTGLPDILVSHVGTSDAWGLKQGDRLVAVDGEHPLTWAKKLMSASLWYWEADDPQQIANILSALRDSIARHASSVTVVHCNASAGTCDSTTTTIDIAKLPVTSAASQPKLVGCDNRPFFAVDGAPADHDFGDALITPAKVIEGPVLDATADEKIQGLIWNTLFGDGKSTPVDAALKNAVAAFSSSRGVLLDHREGHGGTAATANILVSFARTPYTPFISVVRNRADDEGPADAAAAIQIFDKYKGKNDVFGSATAQTDVPVAVLMTWDVSASDFLLKILQGGPKVRLFGPGPSMGAFGTFMQYSTWGVMRWSVGIEDSITPDGTLLCTHGVDPDQLVLQKQSDLLAGKDSVHDAAMTWLRTELKP
jgi:hypothetical protein